MKNGIGCIVSPGFQPMNRSLQLFDENLILNFQIPSILDLRVSLGL